MKIVNIGKNVFGKKSICIVENIRNCIKKSLVSVKLLFDNYFGGKFIFEF